MMMEVDRDEVARGFDIALSAMGLDMNSPHLKETPERMARMYIDELFAGLYKDSPKFTTFPAESNGMVFLGNIDIFSVCSHHFKSFTGVAHIAYIPKDKVVGISKLARVADWYARRPQVQENLTMQIANHIMEELGCAGVAVQLACVHNCIRTRGAKQAHSVMTTTELRGVFMENQSARLEFIEMIENLK